MSVNRIDAFFALLVLLTSLGVTGSAYAVTADDNIIYRAGAWFHSDNPGAYPAGVAPVTSSGAFGFPTDVPLVGDVNGDGVDDVVVVRESATPGEADWFARHTADANNDSIGEVASGPLADSLVGPFGNFSGVAGLGHFLADPNGDGADDIVTVNAGFNWFSLASGIGTGLGAGPISGPAQFGLAGDQPIVGDFNGDGQDDIGVYRPAGGNIFTSFTGGGTLSAGGAGPIGQIGGAATDSLLIGNLNGDAFEDAVMVRQDGAGLIEWFGLVNDGTGFLDFFNAGTTLSSFGLDGVDVPFLADIDGDGLDDIGVTRAGATHFTTFTTAGGVLGINGAGDATWDFGLAGDVQLFGDFNAESASDFVFTDAAIGNSQWDQAANWGKQTAADFNSDGDEDGADFLIWQRGFGTTGTGTIFNGDASGDNDVDSDDLAIWEGDNTSLIASVPGDSSGRDVVYIAGGLTAEISTDVLPTPSGEVIGAVVGGGTMADGTTNAGDGTLRVVSGGDLVIKRFLTFGQANLTSTPVTGTLDMQGGSLKANVINLGNPEDPGAAGIGIANISGGSVKVLNQLFVATQLGSAGSLVNQTGGDVAAGSAHVGTNDVGSYTISSGTLTTINQLDVALTTAASGSTFVQTGGTVATGSTLVVGNGGNGSYSISSGMLTVGSDLEISNNAGAAVSTFTQTGGDVQANRVSVGDSDNTINNLDNNALYEISDGTLGFTDQLLIKNGGTFRVIGDLATSISDTADAAGSKGLTLRQGTLAFELDTTGVSSIDLGLSEVNRRSDLYFLDSILEVDGTNFAGSAGTITLVNHGGYATNDGGFGLINLLGTFNGLNAAVVDTLTSIDLVLTAPLVGSASVPEPSSLVLAAFGLLAFTGLTSRRRRAALAV